MALMTALISGVSIYLNKFAVQALPDAVLFTTLKNTLVGLALLVTVAAAVPTAEAARRAVTGVNRRTLWPLLTLAVLGGSVPFLLFFQGLTMASAPSAALIHKSLFLWVALLAAPLLGERPGAWTIVGLGLLAAGQLLNGWPKAWGWGSGESLILLATFLWAVETIVARRVLPQVSTNVAAAARMAGGAAVMWAYRLGSGQASGALALSLDQWLWVGLTSAFLLGYVTTWYAALKRAPATLVTSVLALGAAITAGLSLVFEGKTVSGAPALGLALMIVGAAVLLWRPSRRSSGMGMPYLP